MLNLEVDFSLYVFEVFEIGGHGKVFKADFVLFPSGLVGDFEELLNWVLGFKFWYFHKLIEEHFKYHGTFPQMLIIIASELSLFGNGRHRQARMQHLQMFLKPLKIRIPPLHFHIQHRGIHSITNIRLTKQSTLLFSEFLDLDIDVFDQKGVRGDGDALNGLWEDLVFAFVVVLEVFTLLFEDNGAGAGATGLGGLLV